MSRFEKPQRKNRHLLAVNQHVYPAASIARFAGADGRVLLHDMVRNKIRSAKADDDVFCARRAWDQRSEAGFMKRIEDAFQDLASQIVSGTVSEVSDIEKGVVDRFYALWYLRARQRTLPAQEIQANGVTGTNLTLDQEENLEINGYTFIRPGGKLLARHINGIQLQILTAKYAHESLSDTKWGIIQAQSGEFIVPDVPLHTIIPLTPGLCLVSSAPNGMILKENVAEINRSVRSASREYFFARDFGCCPF
jgi:hypothetical protein